MSLTSRNKRPYGLIDGCFGPSSYCERCQYEKEPENMGDRFCSICKKVDSISESMKASLLKDFGGHKSDSNTVKNVKLSIEAALKKLSTSHSIMDINDHININVSVNYNNPTQLDIKLVPKDQIGNDFLKKANYMEPQ